MQTSSEHQDKPHQHHFPVLPHYAHFFSEIPQHAAGQPSHQCVLCPSTLRAVDDRGHVHGAALQSHFQHKHPELHANIEATREREMHEDARLEKELESELARLREQAAKDKASAVDEVRAKLAHEKAEAVIRETMQAAREKADAVKKIRELTAKQKAEAVVAAGAGVAASGKQM